MKKRFFSVMLCILVVTFLAACGGASGKTVDESFISAAAKGLQTRWDISDKQEAEGTTINAESFVACIDAELNEISEFKEAEFEDETLKSLASEYIGILEKSVSA